LNTISKFRFELIDEFKLDLNTKIQISALLKISFPEEEFHGRTYFKQLPHYRLLMWKDDILIGQLGLDYRVMTLNKDPVRVMGIIDLMILPEFQHQGNGTHLLKELENIIDKHIHNIDFLFLVADYHKFYERCSYRLTKQKVKWLTIEEHINYGIQEKEFDNCLMIKQLGDKEWKDDGELDMMGYWY